MTLLNLVKYLRESILYDTGGEGVDWTGFSENDFDDIQLRWTNEELVANINEAINMVYRRVGPISDIITINVEAGTSSYTTPSYVLEHLNVKRADGKELKKKSIQDLWGLQEFDTKTGELEVWIPDDALNKVRFYPNPISDEDVKVLVYRLPITTLSWDNYDASPELRAEYQLPMLNGAAALCYMKDESNTLDPKRASDFTALFDRDFPFTSVYSNIRKKRTANRPIRYGGL